MAKYYDIVNVSAGRLKGSITLHLFKGIGLGYSYHNLPANGVLENVEKEQLSDQIRCLARSKKGRPPVIQLVEIDYEARQLKLEKDAEIRKAKAEKRRKSLAKNQPNVEEAPKKEAKKESKEKKETKEPKEKKNKDDEGPSEFSGAIAKALEEGKELPKDDTSSNS